MENEERYIKQKEGAIKFTSEGKNQFAFNWANGMVEIWHNGKGMFIIDMSD